MFWAESVICTSVRAMSPVLQTPMVGACTGGSCIGGPARDPGGTLARYQLRPGVSEPVASKSAITCSASGCRAQFRKLAQSRWVSQRSAMPGNWNSEHVPRFLACSDVRQEGARVADREGDQMVDFAGRKGGERPGQGGAPVVADYVGLSMSSVDQDRHDILG